MNVKIVHRNDPLGLFEETHVSKWYNYWNPMHEETINGIVWRIADGFINWDEKRKTYILYKNENLIGVFYTIDGALNFITNHIP